MKKSMDVFKIVQPEGMIVFVPEARRVYLAPVNSIIPNSVFGKPKNIGLPKIPEQKFVNTEILLNNDCNLKCTYCYANAGTRPVKEQILEKTALLAVDRVAHNAKEIGMSEFNVIMAGGEPTLSFDLMALITKHAKEKEKELGIRLKIGTVTNGLFSFKVRDFLAENMSFVNISIDGWKEIHDMQRPTIAGKGSFDKIYENAKWFNDRCSINLGIRATISLKKTNRMVEIVSYLHREFPRAVIGLDGVQECGRCFTSNETSPDWLIFSEQFKKVMNMSFKDKFAISNGFTRFLNNSDDINYCGADGRNFIVAPSGHVGSCSRVFAESDKFADLFLFGRHDNSSEDFVFDMSRYENLKKQINKKNEKCLSCFAKYNCKGDCAHFKLSSGLELDDLSPRCEAIQRITLHQLRLSLGLE